MNASVLVGVPSSCALRSCANLPPSIARKADGLPISAKLETIEMDERLQRDTYGIVCGSEK